MNFSRHLLPARPPSREWFRQPHAACWSRFFKLNTECILGFGRSFSGPDFGGKRRLDPPVASQAHGFLVQGVASARRFRIERRPNLRITCDRHSLLA